MTNTKLGRRELTLFSRLHGFEHDAAKVRSVGPSARLPYRLHLHLDERSCSRRPLQLCERITVGGWRSGSMNWNERDAFSIFVKDSEGLDVEVRVYATPAGIILSFADPSTSKPSSSPSVCLSDLDSFHLIYALQSLKDGMT
jgi:hypothetical protein